MVVGDDRQRLKGNEKSTGNSSGVWDRNEQTIGEREQRRTGSARGNDRRKERRENRIRPRAS